MKSKFYIIFSLLGSLMLYFSCIEQKDPLSISTHPDGWNNIQSDNFHGKMVLESYANAENCKSCHGVDYSGGSSNVSCSADGCHNLYPHSSGYADHLSDDFHSKSISNSNNWDITVCQTCHGINYDGEEYDKKNCLICHTQTDGPEACNTCHGNTLNYAPPKDLSDNISTTAIGVGAHQQHLIDTTWTTAYEQDCSLCHNEPASLLESGHIDNVSQPAEVIFNLIASGSGLANPVWNHSDEKCSNVYCHGAFVFERSSSSNSWAYTEATITGNNPEMNWVSISTNQDICGSCHGLPPQGHIGASSCEPCHPRVVDSDFNIINKKLHINGNIDIF